jgi:hypothetical protein
LRRLLTESTANSSDSPASEQHQKLASDQCRSRWPGLRVPRSQPRSRASWRESTWASKTGGIASAGNADPGSWEAWVMAASLPIREPRLKGGSEEAPSPVILTGGVPMTGMPCHCGSRPGRTSTLRAFSGPPEVRPKSIPDKYLCSSSEPRAVRGWSGTGFALGVRASCPCPSTAAS